VGTADGDLDPLHRQRSLTRSVGDAILEAGRTAYLSGMRVTEIAAGASMLAMALLTGQLLRDGEPAPVTQPEKELDPHAA
jgi:hypothetical protein